MTDQRHEILIALDDSEASHRALRYVAHMAEARSDMHIHLFHLLRPVPPVFREHGGSEDPLEESRLSEALREKQERWIEEEAKRSRPLLERAKAMLVEGGVPATLIEVASDPLPGSADIGTDCVRAARDRKCRTIVVGRGSLPWFHELFHRHHCHDLVRHAQGFTVWVVE